MFSLSATKSTIRLYHSITDYVDDKTGFSDLDLINFRGIFLAYFLACFLVFTCYLIDLLVSIEVIPNWWAVLMLAPLALLKSVFGLSGSFLRKFKVSRRDWNKTAPGETEH